MISSHVAVFSKPVLVKTEVTIPLAIVVVVSRPTGPCIGPTWAVEESHSGTEIKLPLTPFADVRRISRFFGRLADSSPMKVIGHDDHTAAVDAEGMFMFNWSTKSLVPRAAMWLASALLLWPVPMQQSCGCDRTCADGHRASQAHEPDAAHGSCCHGSRDREAAVKPRTCCCCKSAAGNEGGQSSCRGKATTAARSHGQCCCGPDCQCHLSENPRGPADNTATTTNAANRRIELGQPLRAVTVAVNAAASASGETRAPHRGAASTAIDRCRELSRFTI